MQGKNIVRLLIQFARPQETVNRSLSSDVTRKSRRVAYKPNTQPNGAVLINWTHCLYRLAPTPQHKLLTRSSSVATIRISKHAWVTLMALQLRKEDMKKLTRPLRPSGMRKVTSYSRLPRDGFPAVPDTPVPKPWLCHMASWLSPHSTRDCSRGLISYFLSSTPI